MRLRTRLDRLSTSHAEPGSIEVWLTEDGETFSCRDEVLSAQELEKRQSGPDVLVVDLVRLPATWG